MKEIESAELSAYLDGELDASRAEELETAMRNSPALQGEFRALQLADIRWQSAARSADFAPAVLTPKRKSLLELPLAIIVLLLVLLVLRFIPKLDDVLVVGIVLHLLVLALMLPWLFADEQHPGDPVQS